MIGSCFYIPRLSYEDDRCMTYGLHPTIDAHDYDFSKSWDPFDSFNNRGLSNQVALPKEWDEQISQLYGLIRNDFEDLPDIVDEFSQSLASPPPLVSSRVRQLIEELAPGSCEYVQAPKIYNLRLDKPMDASDHLGVNVLRQIDSWDRTQDTVRHTTRRDGTQYYSLGKEIGSAAAIPDDAHLWRDSFTNHVLCSELFKTRLEEMGATAISFKKINMA